MSPWGTKESLNEKKMTTRKYQEEAPISQIIIISPQFFNMKRAWFYNAMSLNNEFLR